MTYFVTGGTGFIGRRLVKLLAKRGGDIYLLVWKGDTQERVEEAIAKIGAGDRVKPVPGDITEPSLGLSDEQIEALTGKIDHLFHLAAVYDIDADPETDEKVNIEGTQHVIDFANRAEVGTFHLTSSIAVAGLYEGYFREDMFDEGQELPHPYHRTKFESEKLVREGVEGKWRVYRPGIVIGDSRTGEMDKIDGPYYLFHAIRAVRHYIPEWIPLIGFGMGQTNVVPVDFVTRAMDHIAHEPGIDNQAFHLMNPTMDKASDVLLEFCRAAHAPTPIGAVGDDIKRLIPKNVTNAIKFIPPLNNAWKSVLAEYGIPEDFFRLISFPATFDTRDAQRALGGTDIEVPPLREYAGRLWDYWERNLYPKLRKERTLDSAVRGKVVVITGGSSGIGLATGHRVAKAGATTILVARGLEKLEQARDAIAAEGGDVHIYSADLSDLEDIDRLAAEILADHGHVDYLVNNAGRSIRRSLKLTYGRFHDFQRVMQLNYFGAVRLTMDLLPGMIERRFGHIVNISSISAQTGSPHFSAYAASKAALDTFSRCAHAETVGNGVTFSTIHMPLTRTPMVSPTKLYDYFPLQTVDEAAEKVCYAIRTRKRHVSSRLGTFGAVAFAIWPQLVDQVLNTGYRLFPDTAAARGAKAEPAEVDKERPTAEGVAMAHVLPGIHW